jgi:transcriptional regulator with AAA-type ATPase domain
MTKKEAKAGCDSRDRLDAQLHIAREMGHEISIQLDNAAKDLDNEHTPGVIQRAKEEAERLVARLDLLQKEATRHQALAWRAREFIKNHTKVLPASPEYTTMLDNLIDELSRGR